MNQRPTSNESSTRPERHIWVAFLLLALAWGTSFMFIKIAVQTVQPLTLVAGRLLIGTLGLMIILRWRGGSLPRRWAVWRHLLIIGLINVAIPFVLIVWAESGENGLNSGVASILNSTVPLFSILIAGLLMRMETVSGQMIAGLLVGFAGVMLLFGRAPGGGWGGMLPYLAMVTAAACYALGSSYARRHLQGIQPVVLAAGQLLVATVFVVLATLLLEDFSRQQFPLSTLAALIWLGLMGSCVAYILYFYVLQQWGATRTTLVTYLIPVVGVTAGILFLGEQLDWRIVSGGALILTGVGAVNLRG